MILSLFSHSTCFYLSRLSVCFSSSWPEEIWLNDSHCSRLSLYQSVKKSPNCTRLNLNSVRVSGINTRGGRPARSRTRLELSPESWGRERQGIDWSRGRMVTLPWLLLVELGLYASCFVCGIVTAASLTISQVTVNVRSKTIHYVNRSERVSSFLLPGSLGLFLWEFCVSHNSQLW